MKTATTLLALFFLSILLCTTGAPVATESTPNAFPEVAKQLEEVKNRHIFETWKSSIELKKKVVRQSGLQRSLIRNVQQNFVSALRSVNADDPDALIRLQLLAFLFTNTVQSISGTLGSVSSASSSAAGKVGK